MLSPCYKIILILYSSIINTRYIITEDAVAILQRCIGPAPALKIHYYICGMSLNSLNAILHPSLMYGQWYEWDGKPISDKPRFYFDANELGIKVMEDVSNEICSICEALAKTSPELNLKSVDPIFEFLLRVYNDQIKDKTSLYTAVRSNTAYEEIMHPLKETEPGLFVPDFTSRYLTEDIPFGMIPLRGMATLMNVNTPAMDKVIGWAQSVTGKEYLVDGALAGKDLWETSCPQSCGATLASQLFGC